jgi:hypothetical protein
MFINGFVIDNKWNVLRLKSISGPPGEPDAFLLGDIEEFGCPTTPHASGSAGNGF